MTALYSHLEIMGSSPAHVDMWDLQKTCPHISKCKRCKTTSLTFIIHFHVIKLNRYEYVVLHTCETGRLIFSYHNFCTLVLTISPPPYKSGLSHCTFSTCVVVLHPRLNKLWSFQLSFKCMQDRIKQNFIPIFVYTAFLWFVSTHRATHFSA